MSTPQGLYFHSFIEKKLREDKNCVRKSIAHKTLREKLQPFVIKAEDRLSKNDEEFGRATDGTRTWFKIERTEGMRSSKERIVIDLGAERLVALTLYDNGEECGHLQ